MSRMRDKSYGITELKERGWTTTAIKRFLPAEPDYSVPNPHYKNAGEPMKFWLKARVHRVENTKRFLAWKSGTETCKMSALRGVATKIDNMIQRVIDAEITIERGWTTDQIYHLAISTHGGNYEGDPGEFRWSDRTAINCIRHNLTNYEALWKLINRGESAEQAYELLKERVDDEILEAYPQFFGSAEVAGNAL
jgi:hypothetical protein